MSANINATSLPGMRITGMPSEGTTNVPPSFPTAHLSNNFECEWVSVTPILTILDLISIVWIKQEKSPSYLSVALLGYCTELHFKGRLKFTPFDIDNEKNNLEVHNNE